MSAVLRALRVGTWPLSLLYGCAVRARNLAYDRQWRRSVGVEVRVLSVGNLTVGGVGKTPLTSWLVDRARALGLRVGVVARGYGRAPGEALNDEGQLLARRHPDLPQEQDPDRVAACRRLLARSPVDLILLDDGFQHRRLARAFDLVCLDAERPFAQGMLLPAGDLREPITGLRRAHAVVLTRAGALDPTRLAARRAAVCRAAGRELPVLFAEHEPLDIVLHPKGGSEPIGSLSGRAVELLSGIARPGAFERTVHALGAKIVGHRRCRDHHRHHPAEVVAWARGAVTRGALPLTTEKDAVKLLDMDVEFAFLRIGMRFLGREPELAEVGLS